MFADTVELSLGKVRDLRYGENPHQRAAWYARKGSQSDRRAALGAAQILQGRELSFTNLLDLDAAIRIVLEFDEPAAAVIKHTNPCGAAIGTSALDAYVRAREADSLAAFGGIVAGHRAVDAALAEAIVSTFIEAVIAPDVEDEAKPILARKHNLRVVTTSYAQLKAPQLEWRSILGAMLAQETDWVVEASQRWTPDVEGLRVVT